MAGKDQVKVDILGDSTSLKNATADAERSLSNLNKTAVNLGKTLVSAFAVKQIAGFFMDSANAAAADAREQTILATTITNVTGATQAQIASNEAWISSVQNATGVIDTQLRAALGVLVTATEDVAEAQSLAQTAMDISVARGLDLETVSLALAKAHEGQTTALQKMGIQIKDAAGNTMSFTDIMANANEVFGGQAADAAETTAGKMAILKVRVDELKEEIGYQLQPVLVDFLTFLAEDLIPAIQDVVRNFYTVGPSLQAGFASIINNMIGLLQTAVNAYINVYNKMISLPGTGALEGVADWLLGPNVNFDVAGKKLNNVNIPLVTAPNLPLTANTAVLGMASGLAPQGAWQTEGGYDPRAPRGPVGGGAGGGDGGGGGGKKGKTAEQLAEEQRKKDEEAIRKTLEMWADARVAKRELEDNMYADGKLARDKYIALLEQRLTEEAEFTDEWVTEKSKLTRLLKDENDQQVKDAKDAADKQKEIARDLLDALSEMREKQDNMYEVGAISAAEYIAILQGRLNDFEMYSDEWTSIYKELQSLTAGTGQAVDTRSGNMVTAGMGAAGGAAFNISNVNVTANNAEEMVASLNDYARRNGGLRVPGGVTAVS